MKNKTPKSPAKVAASAKKEKPGIGGHIFKRTILYTLLGIILLYLISYYLTWTPVIPEPDVNKYWGPYPIGLKADMSIRPFKIEFSEEIINDLRDRLLHFRKPTPPLENVGFTYGFNSYFLTQVVDYWYNKYDFKERENFFNQYEHFYTNIQGLDIHFMHVVPKNTDFEVVPLLLLHGWPGSFREFYEMIPDLTKPQEGKEFVFELIVPSLPGFGYSQSAARPGLGPVEMAVIMNNLMKRIGHTKYYIQGGDLGHTVGSIMATLYPDNVLGFHTNFPVVLFNPIAHFWITLGSIWPSALEKNPSLQDRLYPLREKFAQNLEETGYMHIQSTKPDTIGSALNDSPAGLAAYILEKFSTWTNPEYRKAYDGNLLKKFSLTHLLDNVMIYWATGSITTSMRVYAETFSSNSYAMRFDQIPTKVPTRGIKFKYELAYSPDSVIKMKYSNYLHSTIVDDGGHFAALENPELMTNEIYEAVAMFREFHGKSNTPQSVTLKTVYDFTVEDIYGNNVKLDKYKGYVLLIVNVASQCGLTDTNYSELNKLHEKYHSRGLRILAFPCNQFYSQEPGTAQDILNFTKEKQVLFDIFAKVDVNGDDADPLWKFLRQAQTGTLGDFIKWNFSKFIVDRNGVPVVRMGPNDNPLKLEPYILKYL